MNRFFNKELTPNECLVKCLINKRPIVVESTNNLWQMFFSSQFDSLSLDERLWAATYTAYLSKHKQLTNDFLQQLDVDDKHPIFVHLTLQQLDQISLPRLRAILHFTQQVTLTPINATQQDLEILQQAGLNTQAIVILTQLIGFICYQVRVMDGINAINDYVALRGHN